ncbi:amino acid adenylation domain-containing protein [Kitasatospora sp. NBC_01287]|uniref:non-ribosomal peptide synthetase n=1 Tax=Kitasatospora sp. NBC_01287 TaxID=2903573 RepID=UPI002257A5EF|nr:non-ribosomal peptide synthetase [Kitasatospora sp. NBC_01287]MCX4744033.1 amino acid adenylation domain-containing protein [Kitasatospora sp. NBC_01287]
MQPPAHGPDPYGRSIAPVDWWLLASLRGQVPVIQLAVEGDGELSSEVLAAAVAAASESCPGARLVRRGRQWVDSRLAPAVRVVAAADFDRDTLDSPLLCTPLTGDRGPSCEVLLVEGAPSTVVFRAFHGVMDGRGTLLWAQEVFRALRGETLLGAPSRLNDQQLMDGLASELPDGLPEIAARPESRWPSPLGGVPPRPRGVVWRRRTVDGTHPAATAKVATVLAEAYGAGTGRFAVPVDLRRHVPEIRSTANLATSVILDVLEGDGWEEVHHRLLTALSERQELASRTDPGLLKLPLRALRLMAGSADAKAAKQDCYDSMAFLSHLGTVDLADFSADGFEAATLYSLGTPAALAPPEIDLVESAGRTEITVAWRSGPGVAEAAEALLDRLEEALSPAAHRDWEGNRTERAGSTAASVLELFRRQVERTPHRVALSGPEGTVSYAELSRRADVVAAELRRLGVARGDVVGLLADRSPAAIAGLWGVLRAGACYLPLDALHPDPRLADLLTDAGAALCLVERRHQERAWCPPGCAPVALDDLVAVRPSGDPSTAVEPRDAAVGPGDLAYVIYTSGSTGKPKGVQIEHGSLLNYVDWASREFGVDADTRLPLITSPSFDVSGTSVFLPLLTGGEVVLMKDETNHLSLRHLLEESGATMLSLTPAHLDLIGRLDLRPSGFRSVVVVGEQLRVPVAARAQAMFGPDCRIINLYGPTEATIGCTIHTFDPRLDAEGAAVPIGLPMDNTTVFLLDQDRRFTARGEVGEMYLGGVQLARGYRGRPDLNRERFVRLADGTRVYRTGDLARISERGELEFIGRTDDQVKVLGHRVEPAEVALALEEHPAVAGAAVVAKARRGQQGKSLFAYAVPAAGQDATAEELERFLADRLPPYMVPAATVVVADLPLTVSGKVDVRALPDPFAGSPGEDGQDGQGGQGGQGDGSGLDTFESAVGDVWTRILQLEHVHLTPQLDFHRLGGDSLSLYAMLATVCRELVGAEREDAFMANLPIIMREPTIEQIAVLVRAVLGFGGEREDALRASRPGVLWEPTIEQLSSLVREVRRQEAGVTT